MTEFTNTRNLKMLTIAACVLALAGVAQAEVINVDFTRVGSTGEFSGLGPAPDSPANTFWNQLNVGGGNTNFPDNLSNSAGNPTSVDVDFTNGQNFGSGNAATVNHFAADLMNDGSKGDLTISDLDPGLTYDLYLFYGSGRDGRKIDFALFPGTAQEQTFNDLEATVGDPNTFVLDEDYIVFSGIAPDMNNEILLNISDGPLGGTGGFQLVAIPEPATLTLLGLGAAVLGTRRRK